MKVWMIPRMIVHAESAAKNNAMNLLASSPFVILDGYLAVSMELKNRQKKLGRRAFDLGSDDVT
jgi:hypothetical protein